jgi:hypothetical protein
MDSQAVSYLVETTNMCAHAAQVAAHSAGGDKAAYQGSCLCADMHCLASVRAVVTAA